MSELTPGELNALVSLLDDSDHEVRSHVRDRIISIGNEIIPFLEEKWENSFNPEIQKEIEELVHDLQFSLLKARLREWRDTDDRDLLTGLWIINTYQYPDLEYAKLNADMHQIYFEVWTAFKNDFNPYEQVRSINNVLYNTLRFAANTKNFHSPANSMLSSVLDSKRGNPLTLCSIYLLIAKKLGLPIYGVNLPNLFVLTYKTADLTFYINAFNKGLIFSRTDIFNYLEQLKIEPKEEYFEPCAHLQIMLRMFRNLENSFEKLGESDKVREIRELIELLNAQ
ncbi:MAG: transglutaminase-like domain-containing protein [Algoriphagus sp.]